MARMHTNGKGISGSMKPFSTYVPTHITATIPEIKKTIVHLANRGNTASMIGIILRDQHGIGNVSDILGMPLSAFLKEQKVAPSIPDDVTCLVDRANKIRLHLTTNKKDNGAKYRLNLINSRIHRLIRYYKGKSVLPANWKPTVGLN